MNLYESIKVNKIDKNKIIKNKAIPANNQYNVEAESTDNEKKLDIVQDIGNNLVEQLRKHDIYAELDDYSIAESLRTNDVYGVIDYSIEWGDWKHDHMYSEQITKNFLKSDNINIDEVVTDEDGSDTYSAYHEVVFDLTPYLDKEIKDNEEIKEGEGLHISMNDNNFDDIVKRDFQIYLEDKYDVKTQEELKEVKEKVTEDDINEYFTGMFYDIVDNDDLDTSNAAEEIIRKEYGFEDEETENDLAEEAYDYLHNEGEFKESEFKHKMFDECPEDVKVAVYKFLVDKGYEKEDLDEVIYSEIGDNNEYLDKIFVEVNGKRYRLDIDGNVIKSGNVITKEAEDKVSEEDFDKLMTFFDKDDETIKRDFDRWTAVRTTMDNIGDKEFPQLDFMIKYNLTPEEKHNLANKICDKIEKELNESDRQLATVKDLDKILKMSNKELDDFDRNHSYENSDLAEYVRCRLLYAETGLAKHKECYEKALNSLKDNKLNESSTEERWNATELDREGFYALLKFNNSEEHLNPSLKYIITRDGNEVYRFAMSGTNEKIKDTGAKIEFRNFLKSKNNEIEETEEIKEDADKNAKYVKSTLNKIALDKISKAIVNIEDAVSLINDNDEAKNKIKSIVEELEDYLNLDDYGRPKA